jgi:hypothetical protein
MFALDPVSVRRPVKSDWRGLLAAKLIALREVSRDTFLHNMFGNRLSLAPTTTGQVTADGFGLELLRNP